MSFKLSVNYAECVKQTRYVECRYVECRYAECRGAILCYVIYISLCYKRYGKLHYNVTLCNLTGY